MAEEQTPGNTTPPSQPRLPVSDSHRMDLPDLPRNPEIIDQIKLGPPGKFADWDDIMRRQWETMWTWPINVPIYRSWKASEQHWERKDIEMLEYLQDYPTKDWLISPEDARSAYEDMLSRWRLRDQGKSVYVDGVPQYWPYGKPDFTVPTVIHVPVQEDHVPKQARKTAAASTSKKEQKLAAAIAGHKVTVKSAVDDKGPRPKRSFRALQSATTVEEHASPPVAYQDAPPPKKPRKSHSAAFAAINDLDRDDSVDQGSIEDSRNAVDDEYAPPVKKRKMRKSNTTDDGQRLAALELKAKRMPAPTPPPYNPPGEEALKDKDHAEFPWQNSWSTEDPQAWDDSIYDPARLAHIRQIHARNARIVSKFMENGKHGAQKRKSAALAEALKFEKEEEETIVVGSFRTSAQKPDKKRPKIKRPRHVDQREHFSGRLEFADTAEERKFRELGYASVEDAIEAAMQNPHDELLMQIEVAHDPGDSILSDLDIPRISIMDIARTRLQLYHTRVLTDRAAECLIDFCPDLLNSYKLLQVVSETRYSNTGVQVRLGQNGSMLSDSTITKRVSAALNREYDKKAAAEALEKDPEFKKTNRDNYEKYKKWRASRRTRITMQPATFGLLAAANKHREKSTVVELKPKVKAKRVSRPTAKKRAMSFQTSSDDLSDTSSSSSRRNSVIDESLSASLDTEHSRTSSGASRSTAAEKDPQVKTETTSTRHEEGTLNGKGLVNPLIPTEPEPIVPDIDTEVDTTADAGPTSELNIEQYKPKIKLKASAGASTKKRQRQSSPGPATSTLDSWLNTAAGDSVERASKRRSFRRSKAMEVE